MRNKKPKNEDSKQSSEMKKIKENKLKLID